MDSDDSKLEKLINQCKSNDVDVKVDALTKLQVEFESGIEINDPDGLVNVLKVCLRTSNQHLTTATLSVLPPLLPLLISPISNLQSHNGLSSLSSSTSSTSPGVVDLMTLRQVLNAFLPAGGIIERLGDKERAQTKARETLVILGGLAFRAAPSSSMSTKSRDGKGPETPIMIFERYLRESGLASKVWKVREQSIFTLVHIRRTHSHFPIRPYLPLLVDALEDTDAHVRECARQSVVELFSGPNVTDAARADLKKEMTKKNVRKTIVDGVLVKVLGGSAASGGSNPHSREGSENGDAVGKGKEYVPPSVALQARRPIASTASGITRSVSMKGEISRPASRAAGETPITTESSDIQPIYVASSRDLENEFLSMHKSFEGKESEHNWAARERAILRVRGMLKGEVHLRYTDTFLASLKDGFVQSSLKTLASLRTTVAVNTCSLYFELSQALGTSLDPFCDTLFTNLLKMAGFTKKITSQQSQVSVSSLIANTSAQPRVILPLLWQTLQEKTVQARSFVVAHIKQYVEVHGHRAKHAIEGSGGLEIIEKSLKKALADPSPAVRENARVCFWTFNEVWRDRGFVILESLDSIARKQLEKVCPNPDHVAELPPVTPKTLKKSSVAAAIAASRAKAKAIATAPPSLRHQATAASHVPATRRPGSPSTSPKNSTTRPASPLRTSTSPPSPRSRIVSNGVPRSISMNAVSSHSTPPSGGLGRPASPPSPSEHSTFRRRTSSPLAPSTMPPSRSSTFRIAAQTALPASPPPSVGRVSPTQRNSNGATGRLSTVFPQTNGDEELLMLAQTVPIPEDDSDSDSMEHSINLMSFSAPFEKYPPATPKSSSQVHSISPKSNKFKLTREVSNALSSDSVADMAAGQPVVEDALRARAEQAESAAERLLELVDPEEDGLHHSSIPSSLLVGSSGNGNAVSKAKPKPNPLPLTQGHVIPVTPVNRAAAVMKQASLFKNSPAYNGRSSSLLDVLQDRKHETGWWLKRRTLIAQGSPLKAAETSDRIQELQRYISLLENGSADVHTLQKLVLLCAENPVAEPFSPLSPDSEFPSSPSPFIDNSRSIPSLYSDLWDNNKNFEKLFRALMEFLVPTRSEEEIEYGLIVLWEMLENQALYIEGREGDIFSLLLQIRYSQKLNVLEATNTIRDALTTRIEPVYGLTTMHASLRAFYAEPRPPTSSDDVKSTTYAFGLIALGKFILRLPAEIAEEELPRLKGTLISSLNNKGSLVVRESAAAAIIAAQLSLRDETHLFALLDGLADDKKNLMTYLFDKHSARGLSSSTGPSGIDRLEKEMRRLDTRTSAPPRPST